MEKNKNLNLVQDQSPSYSLRSNGLPKSQWLQSISSEFEAKTKIAVDLIGVDGDTFSERAEMYYQNRPQAIRTVHDLHRLYMTLADKYEHLLIKSELSPIKIAFSDSSNSPDQDQSEVTNSGKCNGQLNAPVEAITCNVESIEDYLASGSASNASSFEFHSPLNVLQSNTSSGIEVADKEDENMVAVVSKREERGSSVSDNMIEKTEDEPQRFLEENLYKQAELIRVKDEKREKSIGEKNENRFLKSFRGINASTSPHKAKKKANQTGDSKSKFKGFFCLPKRA